MELTSLPLYDEREASGAQAVAAAPTAATAHTRAVAASRRIVFVDLARGVTVLLMVLGHTLTTVLAQPFRENAIYRGWQFIRGLTSPMFLVLAGMSFSVATQRRWSSHRQLGWPLLRRTRRLLSFVALGYLVHLPTSSLAGFARLSEARWQKFLQVDVLQTVGMTLILLQVLVLLCRTPRRFAVQAALVGSAIVAASPVVRSIDWTARLPLSLAAYLGSDFGSQFPLFSWSAFILFGAVLGVVLLGDQRQNLTPAQSARISWRLLAIGLALVTWGLSLSVSAVQLYRRVKVAESRPQFLITRLGGALILLAGFTRIGHRVNRLPAPLQALSEESLIVYLVHLAIVYGCVFFGGFKGWFGYRLDPIGGFALVALLQLTMTAMALGWNRLKKHHPAKHRAVRWAIALSILAALII